MNLISLVFAVAGIVTLSSMSVMGVNEDCAAASCDASAKEVCVGPDKDKVCVVDPCDGVDCGANGDCKYDETSKTPAKGTCTCKNGHGGTACADAPECTKSEDCTDNAKPTCKIEAGKQSVCVAGENGGSNVAAMPGILLSLLLAAIYL